MVSIHHSIYKGRIEEMTDIRQVYELPDGTTWDTKAEALDHLRRPKIQAALAAVTGDNGDLVEFLLDNMEEVKEAFDVGTIRRVTKSDRNKLKKALDAITADANPKFGFVLENAEAILKTFRWPSVARMDDDEKAVKAREVLLALSEGNEEVADWVVENRESILEAYGAGKEKRPVNPVAAAALAEYRAKKAAEKAAKEAAEAAVDASAN
jgi:hypothetical protein